MPANGSRTILELARLDDIHWEQALMDSLGTDDGRVRRRTEMASHGFCQQEPGR